MRRALLLLVVCSSAFAQVYEAKNCVYREGDDARWARPDYDDTGWTATPPNPRKELAQSPYLWERCRVQATGLTPPARVYLQVSVPSAWILYVEGVQAGSFGNPETGRFTMDTVRELPVPSGTRTSGDLRIAIRLTRRYTMISASGDPFWPRLWAGGRADLELRAARSQIEAVSRYLRTLIPAVANLGICVLLLILTMSGSGRRDSLLLGTMSLSQTAVTIVLGLVVARVPVSPELFMAIHAGFRPVAALAPFFAYSMLGRPVPRTFRYGFVAIYAPYPIFFAAAFLPVSHALFWCSWMDSRLLLPQIVIWFIQLAGVLTAFLPWRRYTTIELLMLVPNTSFFATAVFQFIAAVVVRLAPASEFTSLVGGLLFNLFYAVVIALRMRRVSDERESLKDEMRSAREVQRRLVPEVSPIAGFRIDTAYVPAKEVGGDFYHFLPADDGSLLLVVGDVSGKGLDAAMLVAVAIGALGEDDPREPAAVLSRLNGRLMGKTRGGFVTCCCALFRADGVVEIANAGQIPPYTEGREVELPAGPPLGIIAGVRYESTKFPLGTGPITFFSDGVVEATSSTGELLGFGRLAGLSVKPAGEIAKEAERWGQEDDITVVQVAYA
jgi:sigma-B regulation protein RsbU (phosphoserine phosphatase)